MGNFAEAKEITMEGKKKPKRRKAESEPSHEACDIPKVKFNTTEAESSTTLLLAHHNELNLDSMAMKEQRHKKSKRRSHTEAQVLEVERDEAPAEADDVSTFPTVKEQWHKKSKKRLHTAEAETSPAEETEVVNQPEVVPEPLVVKEQRHKKSKKRPLVTETPEDEATFEAADPTEVAPVSGTKEKRHKKSKKCHRDDDASPIACDPAESHTATLEERGETQAAANGRATAPTSANAGKDLPAAKEMQNPLLSPPPSVCSTSVLPPPVVLLPPHSPRAIQPAPFRGAPATVPPYTPKMMSTSSNLASAPAPHVPRPFAARPSFHPAAPMPADQFGARHWGPKRFMCPADFHRRLLATFPPCPPTLKVLRPIGQGNYARVFEATDEFATENGLRERRVCTVKQIPTTNDWTIFEPLRLQESQHIPNVIQCLGCYYEPQRREIWIATERMDGTVLDVLLSSFPLPEVMITDIAHQTLQALHGLHKLNLVHMDVKPANILYRRLTGQRTGMEFKLADFGCVQDQRNGEVDELGEFTYMSPEVILHQPRTTSTDIWNLGVTLLHLADGEPPLNGWDDNLRVQLIAQTTLCPQLREPQRWSPDLADFISKCLVKDFRFRPDAATLLQHPLFLHHPVK
eukprot:GGOE01007377.1.p1 GENE.GGOE01007377.1~~GGOE01007377.1.p1  ORF type:complete len:649 (-),score=149.72 GGOE01007377.1:730-2625(-)